MRIGTVISMLAGDGVAAATVGRMTTVGAHILRTGQCSRTGTAGAHNAGCGGMIRVRRQPLCRGIYSKLPGDAAGQYSRPESLNKVAQRCYVLVLDVCICFF